MEEEEDHVHHHHNHTKGSSSSVGVERSRALGELGAAQAGRQRHLPQPEHWGLDPLFWSHVKLFISDILAMPSFPGFMEPFNLNGHPVARVAVMGVVVEVLPRADRLFLVVDDGTECIQCTYFVNSMPKGGAAAISDLQIGCLISLQGKLHQFRQQRSIAIFHLGIEEDPNAEAQHVMEVIDLMQTVYKRPSPTTNFTK